MSTSFRSGTLSRMWKWLSITQYVTISTPENVSALRIILTKTSFAFASMRYSCSAHLLVT